MRRNSCWRKKHNGLDLVRRHSPPRGGLILRPGWWAVLRDQTSTSSAFHPSPHPMHTPKYTQTHSASVPGTLLSCVKLFYSVSSVVCTVCPRNVLLPQLSHPTLPLSLHSLCLATRINVPHSSGQDRWRVMERRRHSLTICHISDSWLVLLYSILKTMLYHCNSFPHFKGD